MQRDKMQAAVNKVSAVNQIRGKTYDEDKIKQANELIVSLEGIGEKDEIENHSYYPICEYSIITMLDENSHPSYIKAGLEICDDIIKYPPKIGKDWNQYQKDGRIKMIKFAEKFTKKYR